MNKIKTLLVGFIFGLVVAFGLFGLLAYLVGQTSK